MPDIDLVLQLFRVEIGGQMQLRGLIDSQETLTLWPMDAQIIGYPKVPRSGSSLDNEFRNGFWLKAEYVLPPGDVNNYPYEYLKTDVKEVKEVKDPITGLSYRTSAEGDRFYHQLAGRSEAQPNFLNPTIRFLRREIFLQGAITGVDMGKSTAKGEYQETWTGLLPGPVTLKGEFTLTRENHLPLARRPFIFTADKGSISINQPSKLLVNRALVLVDPKMQGLEKLRLIGPDDKMSYELACAKETDSEAVKVLLETPRIQGTPWQPMELKQRLVKTELEKKVKDYRVCELKKPLQADTLLPVWDNRDIKGAWKLSASHDQLDWMLLLYGVPVHSVQGKVIVQGATGRDIDLQINGLGSDHRQWLKKILVFYRDDQDDRDEVSFTLDNLPGLHIQLIAQKPGYHNAVVDGLETENDPRGYRNGIRGILPGDPTLKEPPQANYTLTLKPLAKPPAK